VTGAPAAVLAAGEGSADYLAPVAGLVVAAALIGYLSVRLRVVPIVGFLLAGVAIGPSALGLVQRDAVEVAAEIGVILLLFTIGIEFSLGRLARIRRLVLVGGSTQVVVTTLLCVLVLLPAGVAWRDGLFTGFLVALSSTAIVLKIVRDTGRSNTLSGQAAVGILIFQDLAVVVMVLVVPLLGSADASAFDLAGALARAVLVVVAVVVVARRVMPRLLEMVARACSTEVFLLSVVAICFGTAYLTSLAGVSVSLGAFLAGLVVSESRHSEHALGEILPLQILFSATFFVSVGMLLDLGFLMANPLLVLAIVAAVLAVKVIGTAIGVAVLRVGGVVAGSVALLLAQVGEFSFVLDQVGRDAGLSFAGLGEDGSQGLVAATVLLMVASPALAAAGRRMEAAAARRPHAPRAGAATASPAETERGGHVVISGWGDASRALAADLHAGGVPFVVVTLNPDGAAEAEDAGYDVLRGDSTKEHVLDVAGVRRAATVVVAEDDAAATVRIATLMRDRAPQATVVVRTLDDDADLDDLAEAGADHVIDYRRSSAAELSRAVLQAARGRSATASAGSRVGATVVDTTAVLAPTVAVGDLCVHADSIRAVLPTAAGCEDCLREGTTWVHLRVCLSCGYVGCCDSSPQRHARGHAERAEHPIIASAEPGEDWVYCFLDGAQAVLRQGSAQQL